MRISDYILCAFNGSCLPSLARTSPTAAEFSSSNPGLVVDLGYSQYRGFSNSSTNINHWRGIRYAAPPIGSLRYQAPQLPQTNTTSIIEAADFSAFAQCPQTGTVAVGASTAGVDLGAEDCLFLSVSSPVNATELPVFVWIHGGGFQNGNGKLDFSDMIEQSNNSLVVVTIQYRLSSFGFLSSTDVKDHGQLNAGLLDQRQALEWVQDYIHLFGGNSSHVTLGGESAGAASIYYHTVAENGQMKNTLWTGSILSSVAAVKPYKYDAAQVSRPYYRLAEAAGCISNQTTFECLVDAPFETLLNASNFIAGSELYAIPPFEPVVDGDYITASPSELLLHSPLNGRYTMIGNQANEGFDFTPQFPTAQFPTAIDTAEAFDAFVPYEYPLLSQTAIDKVLAHYPPSLALNFTNYDELSSGIQEVANNMVAEPVFYCTSIWMATALERAYRYQFSIPPALHATDLAIYLPENESQAAGGSGQSVTEEFRTAFLSGWINFILTFDPSSSALSGPVFQNGVWPQYTDEQSLMVNFNVTGGTVEPTYNLGGHSIPQVIGGQNDFSLIDERTWQGGRGGRCDFWRGLGGLVPV